MLYCFANAHRARSHTDVDFVLWVNVLAFADVDNDRLTAVGEFIHRHGLCLAKLCPIAVAWLRFLRMEVSKLNPIEWEIALSPFITPVGDHVRK